MAAHAVDRPSLREFLAAAIRLAGVAIDDEGLAHAVPLVEAVLADWPLLTRAASSRLEPMSSPRRPAAGS
jgi:hypothetical protein